ncbi:MAG: hypothetical protein HQL03_00135 [Nitrospirae bacterium]|nr:hypothetical protein [Nitrospirota bacterium]MBF0591166.1 hypothetical protein [Nitrospirota bacterium]
MKLARFREDLLIYGTDLRAWPEDERQEGEALLRGSTEAARVYDEEVGFESMLSQRRCVLPADDLAGRIIAAIDVPCSSDNGGLFRELLVYLGFSRVSFGVVAAAAVIIMLAGVIVGYTDPLNGQSTDVANLLLDYTGEIL